MLSTTDKFAILELLNRYVLSIDTHDDAQFADNFDDDGVYESPFGTAAGRTAILQAIHQWPASDGTAIVASGEYADVITRRDGVWRLQHRRQTIDPSFSVQG